jgi:hypothetical protein
MTTQATHTPGPWYVLGDYVSSKSGGEVVCPIKRIRAEDLSLIAAAPDLLEALQGMAMLLSDALSGAQSSEVQTRQVLNYAADLARAAIAKAEGRAE